jgi:hypothetical protein
MRMGLMVEGSLITHYKPCGNKRCKCARGELHGPYWYLSTKGGGKTRFQYIHKKSLQRVRQLANNYKIFQGNMQEIRNINRQINVLFKQIRSYQVTEGHKRCGG